MAEEKKFNIGKAQPGLPKKFHLPFSPSISTKPSVIIGRAGLAQIKKHFISTGSETEDAEIGVSRIFNRPIYSDVTFHEGQYIDQNNHNITYTSLNVQDVLITVGNTKNIIETTLQGRNGTVKEYISDGDYTITIQGKIYGQGMNNYPQIDVQKLIDVCLVPQSIKVTSSFLKLFNVEDLVIKSYNIDQLEGIRNYQPFVLNCVSDFPLILLKNA